MKKIGLIMTGVSLSLLLLVAGAWAADLTLTDATGPDLVYQMSPNVSMEYADNAADDIYIITSANSKGTMAYGILSTYSGYYQETIEVGVFCPDAIETGSVCWACFMI